MTMTPTPTTPGEPESVVPQMFVRAGYHPAEDQYLTGSDLRSVDVHGREGGKIGAISAALVGQDGAITGVVVDIGGFLGIGMHSILVPFDALTVLRKTDGTSLHVNMDATEDQLKSMPHHGE